MKKCALFIFLVFLITLGCARKEPIITIVDIGQNNRIELGKQLRIINSLSPKIIGLDFFLIPDSLDKDSILVTELNRTKNSVQCLGLNDLANGCDNWNDMYASHPKFKVTNKGYATLSILDSIVYPKLPIKQYYKSSMIYSFSYLIATNSFGLKSKYKNKGTEEINFNLNNADNCYKIITREELTSGNYKKEDFNDKIVIMGYIGDAEDVFYIDEDKKKKLNGVEIHAIVLGELLDR